MSTIDDAAWPVGAQQRRLRLRPLTALLSIALIGVAGIYGGAELEKRHGTTASGSTPTGASRAAGGFTPPGGSTARGTSGTVTEVTPKLLYLTTSAGTLVKVKLTAKTTFTRTAAKATGGLAIGDTATVIGATANGTVTASSVIATAKGVSSTGPAGFGAARSAG
jgi:hypothetical protein